MLDKVTPDKSLTVPEGKEPVAGSSMGEIAYADHDAMAYPAQAPNRGRFGSAALGLGKGLFQAILMVAILFAAYMATNRLIASKPEPRTRPPFQTVYTVDMAQVALKDHRPTFVAYGQTIAARTVELRSLVGGEIVKISPKLRAGGAVAKGDALVEIDDFTYRGNLTEAKANVAEMEARIAENRAQIDLERSKMVSAQEQLDLAAADLTRAKNLRSRNTVTQQQLEARELVVSQRNQAVAQSRDTIKVQQAKLAQLQASLDRLEWGVQQAERNLQSTALIAPFDGIVRSSSAEAGRNVTANDVVLTMYEAGSLEVSFTLSDARFGRLQSAKAGLIGRAVEVVWTVGGNETVYTAKIDRVGADIMSDRGGVEVIAKLEQVASNAGIRPGAFVEVRVPDRTFPDTAALPDTVLYDGNRVYVVEDGKLKGRSVTVASFDGETALISAGLEEGEQVLVTRITEVSDGLNVRTEEQAAEAALRAAQPAAKE
ncbi:MAG: efflux RND transporter periplasmic adaptor subunit [Pseudomonadota bacterium]